MEWPTDQKLSFRAEKVACVRGERELFSNLSFSLAPGEALVIKGPNGSGKTSLLRLIAGLLPMEEGTLFINEEHSKNPRNLLQGLVNYLGHAQALKSFLTVRENLCLWARLHGERPNIRGACERVGIGALVDFPVRFLSEGQKRRINLARLVCLPLPIWLLDEPAASLDREGLFLVSDLMRGHLENGGIILVATHHDLRLKKVKTLTLGSKGFSMGRVK